MTKRRVAVSNGFGQFHLARLAEGLAKRDSLHLFLTAAYPPKVPQGLLSMLGAGGRRLGERRVDVPRELVKSCWTAEVPHQLAQRAVSGGHERIGERLGERAFAGYRAWASKTLTATQDVPDIYHYRAGFGGESVNRVRRLGLPTICDHSIAHPRVLENLVADPGLSARGYWRAVVRDVDTADALLVNSDFVRDTCIEAGLSGDKIHVAYTAVDSEFAKTSIRHSDEDRFEQVSVLFAGTVELRKGADIFLQAIPSRSSRGRASYSLVGAWMPDMQSWRGSVPQHVSLIAKLPRREFADRLGHSSVFVFPSRAEGSARVVSEALVAGCYVITTHNAGSVVRDGIDGRLVPTDDPCAVRDAVDEYLAMDPAERRRRSAATQAFALERLSEERYLADVLGAYDLIR